jgi:hypothetical protein
MERTEKGTFAKGHKGFKPKGATNKAAGALRTRINKFLSDNWEQIEQDFQQLEPKERLIFYERIMRYGLPQLQSIQYTAMIEKDIESLSDADLDTLLNRIIELKEHGV